jgi:heme/copper-type cytochrome/quinol oxidase subunit 2
MIKNKLMLIFLTVVLFVIFITIVVMGSLEIFAQYYSYSHPLSDGTDDLGLPMFSVFWTAIITVIFLPFSVIVANRFAKRISNYFIKE